MAEITAVTGRAGNITLALRCREIAAAEPRGSGGRLGALAAGACLTTTGSVSAARKALAEVERVDIRARAGQLLAELLTTTESLQEESL